MLDFCLCVCVCVCDMAKIWQASSDVWTIMPHLGLLPVNLARPHNFFLLPFYWLLLALNTGHLFQKR